MAHTLAAPACSELVIRKSRFIGCVEPVADRDAALARVAALRAEHPGAAHVCWALLAAGQSAAVDDGEPGGTAGQPMLRVLRHHDLDGVLATVVRYFGGIKLGAGGLVRAYTDAVARALDDAHKIALRARVVLECEIPYELEGLFRREIELLGARLEAAEHGAAVKLSVAVYEDALHALRARLDEAGQGRMRWIGD
ncbi:IMPACT family protein [Pseudazoarcus pumilus]|uniref:IMPACT family protein n=1 Tax=Pseudazoarcus pumilus TaxID=2067960 RepID=A0A2I6S681_9RHOO|nr:YigZ family protein [Pseudazoarcus pumilus]AUN94777.1 IMPACT family protein [Pseudazoarcus pumilus]